MYFSPAVKDTVPVLERQSTRETKHIHIINAYAVITEQSKVFLENFGNIAALYREALWRR